MRPRSLYIHVPFCSRRCLYCDFAVEATREAPVAEWLDAVVKEIALTRIEQGWDEPLVLDTLYVGGGTPSLLGTGTMSALLDRLAPHAVLAPHFEWTCEANPESFTPLLARDWHAAGVNRISLGVQSFDGSVLRWMGRLHGPDGARDAIAAARANGFDNIGLDLIFGLPEHLDRDWAADLNATVALAPEHVSLYGLTAESGAPLGRRVEEGREKLASEDRYAEDYLLAHEVLTKAGYEHYEVSNFGRPGLHSRHNAVYWSGEAYAAAGPGAHALLPPQRRWNLRSWPAYRDSLAAGVLPLDGRETIDEDTAAMERVWLGLRTSHGYAARSDIPRAEKLIEAWVDAGLASFADGLLRATARGWLLLDQMAIELQAAEEERTGNRKESGVPAIDARPRLVQIAPAPTTGS